MFGNQKDAVVVFGFPTPNRGVANMHICLITVLIYPLIYLILSCHLEMLYLGSCSMQVAVNFNVIVGMEGIVVKTGVYGWSHHSSAG